MPVRVWREAGTIRIVGDTTDLTLSADCLSRTVSAGTLALNLAGEPDWRLLFRGDPDGFDDLPRQDRITLRAWGWIGAAVAAVVSVALVVWLFGNSALVWAAPYVPHRVAEGVGRPYADLIAGGERGCETAAGNAALARLVARLTPPGGLVEPVQIHVARTGQVNAFALPGGQLILLDGLIQAARGPDEVAGVLAHEIGHIQRRHPNQALIRHFGMDIFLQGLGGNMGSLASTGLFLRHSRSAEAEADREALALLSAARISPAGIADFFERLGQDPDRKRTDEDALGRLASLAATHPSDASRMARFRYAPWVGTTPAMSAADWTALRAMCGR